MDIQKENTKYLASLLANCGATQDEINDLSFDDEVGFFESNRLADWFVSQINFGWRVWQAAKAQAVSGWIETAIQPPEEGQKVIISGIYGVGIAEFSYLYKDEFVMYDMGASNPILSKDQVKFWMPLPDAPQEPTDD